RKLLELFLDAGTAPHSRGVVNSKRAALPRDVDRDRVACDAGLGAGEQPFLSQEPIDQRRLAGVRTADDRDADGARPRSVRYLHLRMRIGVEVIVLAKRGRLGQCGAQGLVEIGEPLTMLRRYRDRLTEPKLVALEPP